MRKSFVLVALALSLSLGATPFGSALASIQLPAATSPSSSAAVSGSAVVAEAKKYLGYPYAYTGASPATGFSCIGFVWYVYKQLGDDWGTGDLKTAMSMFPHVRESNLLPGDIIFFQNTWWAGVSHVAIYIGHGQIIHAEDPQNGVTISSLVNDPRDGNYWQQHYLVAERPWTGAAGSTGPVATGTKRHAGQFVYVTARTLNLRSSHSRSASVIMVLPHGTKLRLEGWAPGWMRVRTLTGTVGWVMRGGVAKARGVSGLVRHRHHNSRRVDGRARRDAWANARTVHVYGLRVHSAPSRSAPVIATLVRGDRVGILTHRPGWDKVLMADGTVGWSMSRYLGHGRLRHHHLRPGHTPLRSGVNLRSAPSMKAPVVAVSNGRPVHVLRWAPGWVKVRLSTGTAGWVWREFIGKARLARAASRGLRRHHHNPGGQRVRSSGGLPVTAGVRIHNAPSIHAPVIGATTSGMRVRVLGHHGRFAHVHASTGIRGWMESRYIRR